MSGHRAPGRRESGPAVVVVGGGLAGITAALTAADAGARVVLLERRPRLGGATFSVRRDGLSIDNGQHVFTGAFSAYRGLLRRLGVTGLTALQDRLRVPVLRPGRAGAVLRRAPLPAPFHLAAGLAAYRAMTPADRARAVRAGVAMRRLDPADPRLDGVAFGDWLAAAGQRPAAVAALWELLGLPALNLPVAEASLALAVKVFRTALLDDRRGADLGWARVPLDRLHADPAGRALAAAGAQVRTGAVVDAIAPADGGLTVSTPGGPLDADAVVLAVPHDVAATLLPDGAVPDPGRLLRLGTSPIVDLHVVYDRPVTRHRFAAGLGTPVQWIFDRTEAAGLRAPAGRRARRAAGPQYLAVSLSAADAEIGMPTDELRERYLPALEALFPAARAAQVRAFVVTRERAATFRQAPGTAALRPGARTAVPGLYLAGAWTDTGWPATMEGAVRSGLTAARAALAALGRPAKEVAA